MGFSSASSQGNDGWEPVLAVQSDVERRVLRLVDWVGGQGVTPEIPANNYIGPSGFTNLAGATDIRGAIGQQGVQGIQGVAGQQGPAGNDGATGPQGQQGIQGVQGIQGNVGPQGPAGTPAAATRSTATASASTVLTTLISYNLAAGEVVAGSEYEFSASLRVINTTTATNGVATLSVGATNVLILTQALGATAAASPGAPVLIKGVITFLSTTQAECTINFFKSQAVASNILLSTSAPIAVSAAGVTTIDLKFNTSGATSTFICRQASIKRVK